jgi:hypothetical protein
MTANTEAARPLDRITRITAAICSLAPTSPCHRVWPTLQHGPTRDRRIGAPTAFVSSGIDRAQIGQLWVQVYMRRGGLLPGRPGPSQGVEDPAQDPAADLPQKRQQAHHAQQGDQNKILELQAC